MLINTRMSDTTRAYNKLVDLLTGLTGLVKVSLRNAVTMTQTSVVVTASSTALLPINTNRRYLAVMNTGSGDAYLGIGGAAVAGQGWLLSANGGGMVWEGTGVLSNAITAISNAGTTIVVIEG